MKLRILTSLALLAVSSSMVGCGGGPVDTTFAVPTGAITESARSMLEDIKKSGKKSSNLSALETDINGIKSTDKEKGELLLKLYLELDAASTPDKIKEKAAEMLSKL